VTSRRRRPARSQDPSAGRVPDEGTGGDRTRQDVPAPRDRDRRDEEPRLAAGEGPVRPEATERVEETATRQSAAAHGLLEILASKRRLMAINFLAGLSRGVGFFLGVTLIGGLLLGGLALSIDIALSTFGSKITLKDVVREVAQKSNEIQALWRQEQEQLQADAPDGAAVDETAGEPPAGADPNGPDATPDEPRDG